MKSLRRVLSRPTGPEAAFVHAGDASAQERDKKKKERVQLRSLLFHCDGLGQVTRFVHIAAAQDCDMVGEQLERENGE